MRKAGIGWMAVLILAACGPAPQATQPTQASTPETVARQYFNYPNRTDSNPYSNAVLVGNTLYLAGDIGVDPATGVPPPEIEQEVRILLDGMKARLEMAGMTMDDLVSVQVFCPDLSLYDQFNAIYRTYFTRDFPARAFIGSGPLLLGGHFEVMGIAIKE